MVEDPAFFAAQRARMVAAQLASRGIVDSAVLAAFDEVPREAFVLPEYRQHAYEDTPLPIPCQQTISQPYVVAYMISLLRLKPAHRVLEIGTGSGYAAAVLSRIVAQVYTVERYESLAQYARDRLAEVGYDNVHVRLGDGTLGWPEQAPYDGIVVAAGGPHIPPALKEQLAVGGRLVIPVGSRRRQQRLVLVERRSVSVYDELEKTPVAFVPLVGKAGWDQT